MPKVIFQNGVMRIDADAANNDDTLALRVKQYKGKGAKVSQLTRAELEAVALMMAKKLGIEIS